MVPLPLMHLNIARIISVCITHNGTYCIRMKTMMENVAMMMKGMPGNVGRVRGYRPLNMVAAMRMQVASTEAEKENMAPVEIRSGH